MELVEHSGSLVIRGAGHARAFYSTEVKPVWTEGIAVQNKVQVYVFAATYRARERLPFLLLGIDSDNGSEFINDQLYRYYMDEEITFTAGQVGKKNDNAYAEQKNWLVCIRFFGHSLVRQRILFGQLLS